MPKATSLGKKATGDSPASSGLPRVVSRILAHNCGTPMAAVQRLKIVEANKAFAGVVGTADLGEVVGKSLSRFVPASGLVDAAKMCGPSGDVIASTCTSDVVRYEGTKIRVDLTAIQWPDDPSIALVVVSNVTYRGRPEQESESPAREPDPYGLLLNTVSHDIRSPLTSIEGYARLLLDDIAGPLNEDQKALTEKIVGSSKTLVALLEDLLQAARSGQGVSVLIPRWCKPWRVVKYSVSGVLPQASEKGITISLNETISAIRGIYDREKFRTVVTNLLSNAIKYTDSGGVEVIVESTSEGTEVVVADTGVGIPSDALLDVFGEFERLSRPAAGAPAGFGLGLAIAARMVETMGAGLVVSSEPGTGTAFTLFVPALPGSEGWQEQAGAQAGG